MEFTFSLRHLLVVGLLLEVVIVASAMLQYDSAGEIFRHAARWSGRASLLFYLLSAVAIVKDLQHSSMLYTKRLIIVFCVLHFIHLSFVIANVQFNDISLVPFKLAGGMLAYAMILFYPFVFEKSKDMLVVHLTYFYYVGLVMAVTILARLRGDFEGSEPSMLHYIGLVAIGVVFVWMAVAVLRMKRIVK